MPTFETAHIPVRKRRGLWIPGLILIITGLALFGAGWINGSRGGSVYVDEDGFHMNVNEAGKETGIHINEFDLPAFDAVEVQANFADIRFEESNDYGLEIKLPPGHKPRWEIINGKLEIEVDNDDNLGFQIFNLGLTESCVWVYYPEGQKLETVDLEAGSGSIYAAVPYVNEVMLETGSGDIEAWLNESVAAEARAGSGSIVLYSEGGIWVKAEAGSGDINLNGGEWIDADLKTGSGSINIEGTLLGGTIIETGSGDVEVSGLNPIGYDLYGYDIATGSGSIRINGHEYDRNFWSAGGSDNEIKVRTGSGSIGIEE
jgi:hypothetical protein